MRTDDGRAPAAPDNGWTWFILATLALFAVGYGVLELGTWLDTGAWLSGHPVAVLQSYLRGDRTWTGSDTFAAAVVAVLVAAAVVGVVVLQCRRRDRAAHVDRKARHMGRSAPLSLKTAQAKADDGELVPDGTPPGLLFARAVTDGADLYAGWREGMLIEMGPGAGKTTGIAVPLIVDAPGVVVATSNKRDLADGVRGVCAFRGTFWCFDPQRIANYHGTARPSWWWNPLRPVTGPVEAEALAQIFADATAPADSSKDGYFDSQGPSLLANLLLAAAVSGRQLPQVYRWLSNPRDGREPVALLETAGHGLSAAALRGTYAAAPDERSGLFGTASKALKWITSPAILEWVTNDDPTRTEFDPERFVRSRRDTLISLSREGVGTAGPLTTALTVAVTTAAERYATEHPHGRLPVPIVAVLDEIANVCRWSGLPGQFSHYGSAGIFLVAILQSWAQGVGAWKQHGIEAMWGAATIRVVGAGLADRKHLEDVARLVDEHRVERTSVGSSTGDRSSRSTTVSTERELILSAGDIHALPSGYAVVLQSGAAPVLARTVPWMDRPGMAARVQSSRVKYGPKAAS